MDTSTLKIIIRSSRIGLAIGSVAGILGLLAIAFFYQP